MNVTVQYYKYPRTLHWRHDMIRLGEDSHGVWLGGRPGSVAQRGEEPAITIRQSFVKLIPSSAWWTAIFNDPIEPRVAVYVDITTLPTWVAPDRVEMVDLDLDVIRQRDGVVYVDDEDEFEEHRVSLGYPPRLIDSARAVTARMVMDLENARPPFDGTSESWMERVAQTSPDS